MIGALIVILGIAMLVYALVVCSHIRGQLAKMNRARSYSALMILIGLFIVGYAVFAARLANVAAAATYYDHLVAGVFFFGAVFVVLVTRINHGVLESLVLRTEELAASNSAKDNANRLLERQAALLKEAKDRSDFRSAELDKTLEDFYTLRLAMESASGGEKIKRENESLKERLDDVRENR
jgi:hypothetical protein